MDAQFENLCRVCAANTKNKNNSVVESVFIFKTAGLKDKISRHLYLNVAEDDLLPKVLCKSCYRQVEATASLSNIAKHTQLVFRDFLLSTVPKSAREFTANDVSAQENHDDGATNAENRRSNIETDEFRPILLSRGPETSITMTTSQKRDEIGSHREPHSMTALQTGLASSSSTGNLALSGRRNSVFIDSRYGSTPMSIAQRSMQQLPSLAPEVTLLKATSKYSPEKKHSPAGVINFIQTHGRITGKATPTISCGKQDEIKQTLKHAKHLPSISGNLSNLPNNVLQQKRRNLKNAVNNIKAIQSGHGQVSLLKTSQPNSNRIGQTAIDGVQPLVTTTVVPHQSLYGCETSVEEALPEHIIIAAPKKKKEETERSQPHPTGIPQKLASCPLKSKTSASIPVNVDFNPQTIKTSTNVSSLTDAISLGNVIRDPDLLKLILKALKWPVSSGNCEEQMTRLKSSKFAVIMSDRNLLQDTDLTQLLGPYLGPMLAVAQQQHHQKQPGTTVAVAASGSPTKAMANELASVTDLSCAMPYKLPPETSLQLVPSSPTEQEPPTQQILLTKPTVKRTQRKSRNRELPTLASEAFGTSSSNAARVANELLNINAMLLSQFGSNPADALNEALVSMLKEQQQETTNVQSRRHSASPASAAVINLEDIVLVEPQPSFDEFESITDQEIRQHSEKVIIEQKPLELPSRPIIKRRKTVIQTSKQVKPNPLHRECPRSPIQNEPHIEAVISKSARVVEPLNITGKCSETASPQVDDLTVEILQTPTSTVLEITSPQGEQERDGTDGETTGIGGNGETKIIRKSDVKAVLGQKLLEAIGLPHQGKDVPPEASRDSLRTALKRSLKQAQEQQQQLKRVKQEEPVKQMADSTTKPSLAESAAEEHKKAIAERELALLKRKSKVSEQIKVTVKDEKSERGDVSSSSSRNRRNRKPKGDTNEEDYGADDKKLTERWDEDDDLPLKSDGDKLNRPTRTSKTMSKYYKGPAMATRSTRHR